MNPKIDAAAQSRPPASFGNDAKRLPYATERLDRNFIQYPLPSKASVYKILNLDYDCNITEELKTVIGSIIEYGKRQNFNGELFVLFSNDPAPSPTDSNICKGIARQREADDDDGGIPVKKQRIEE